MTEKANFDVGIKILQDLTPSTKKHLKPFFNIVINIFGLSAISKIAITLFPFLILITLLKTNTRK